MFTVSQVTRRNTLPPLQLIDGWITDSTDLSLRQRVGAAFEEVVTEVPATTKTQPRMARVVRRRTRAHAGRVVRIQGGVAA